MSARRALRVAALLLGAGLTSAAMASGCFVAGEESVTVECPTADPRVFSGVSAVLEKHCGTLDCHGNSFRPFRIYGQRGLRKPEEPDSPNLKPGEYAQYYPGGLETTDAELLENARSICGLEPEKTQQFREQIAAGGADPKELAGELLTIVRKARLQERHKGGRLWNEGEAGDQCLVGWLSLPAPGDAGPPPIPACAQAD